MKRDEKKVDYCLNHISGGKDSFEDLKNRIYEYINPEPDKGSDYLVDYLVRVLLFLFPLYVYDSVGVMGISMKDILFGIVVLIMTVRCIRSLLRKKICLGKKELFILGIFVSVLACFCIQTIALSAEVSHTYFYVGMFLLPFCVGFIERSKKYYMNIFVSSYIIVYLSIFIYIFTAKATFLGFEEYLDESYRLVPSFLLSSAVCAFLYIIEENKKKQILYLVLEAVGLIVLFLYGDTVAFMMLLIFLMCLQFVRRATVNFVKKNLILLFVFAFCASNVPILARFGTIGINRSFNLKYSICIDMFIAIACFFIAGYWDRIPKDHKEDCIVMVKFSAIFKQAVLILIVLLGLCFVFGSKADSLLGGFGGEVLTGFSGALWDSVSSSYGELWHVLEVYGIVGSAVLIIFSVFILNILYKAWKNHETTEEEKGYIMITLLFIVQSLFYPFTSVSMPSFLIFAGFAFKAVWKSNYISKDEKTDSGNSFDAISKMEIFFITVFSSALLVLVAFALYRTFVPAGAEGGDSSLVQTVIEQKEQQTITMDEKENNNEEKENGL